MWRNFRLTFLSENPLCVACLSLGRHTPSFIADHIIPHHGNIELFWDEENIQALCNRCHFKKTSFEGVTAQGLTKKEKRKAFEISYSNAEKNGEIRRP